MADIQGILLDELSWRRKELSDIKSAVEQIDNERIKKVILRTWIVLLYAHWEGFIKEVTQKYIREVNKLGIRAGRMSHNLAQCIFLEQLKGMSENKTYKSYADIYSKIMKKRGERCKISETINTKSNLTKKIFEDILFLVDIDENWYLSKYNFIDDLVNMRNEIAHGRGFAVTLEQCKEYNNYMISIMEKYLEDLVDCYTVEKFKRKAVRTVE